MTILIRTVLVLSVAASAVAVGEMLVALRWMRSKTQWNALFFPSGAFLLMSITVLMGLWPNPNPGTAGLLLCAITFFLAMGAVLGVASLLRLMRAQQTRDDDAAFLRIRYQRLFKQNELPILVSEAESLRIVDANAAAATLFEIPMESLMALTVLDLGIEEDSTALTVPADLAARTAPGLRHRAPSGAERELVMHRSVVGVGEKHLNYDIIEDVSDRNAARRALLEQKDLLAHRADHDALTELPNRRILDAMLEKAVAQCARGSSAVLMFIDVDDFKTINDKQGHQAGDATLVSIAQILNGAVRAGDVVARIGGDEFAILLDPADIPAATDIADRLVASTREAFPGLGLSIGVTSVADADGAADALRRADRCMYEAKAGGKSRVVIDGC
jgi:diguanylate cyclase (GGDEF)-like protein